MDTNKLRNRRFNSQEELIQALQILFEEDKQEYIRQCGDDTKFRIQDDNQWVILGDCIQEAGAPDEGYFFQDMWGARKVYESGVKRVYDIGSSMSGYIAHLLSMNVEVVMIDIRPFTHDVDGLHFIQADAMSLSNIADNSIQTLSSLCALEHFGLGRYSDPIDYHGWKKSLHAIKQKLKVGGHFYLSVPVGKLDKVVFNAHRVFNPMTIIGELSPELELIEFSYVRNWKIHTCLSGNFNQSVMERTIEKFLVDIKNNGEMGLFAFKKSYITPPLKV